MSTDTPTPPSEDSSTFRRLPGLLPTTTRTMLLTWGLVCLAGYALYHVTSQQSAVIREGLSATREQVDDLALRVRAGDRSAIAELEAMRKRVEDIDRTLNSQREQFQQLADRADEAQSRQAVQRAKIGVLQADVAGMRNRLQKLKSLHAQWTAQKGTLLTGDPGRRIAASASHFALLTGILDGDEIADDDIQKWELRLESLARPVQASQQSDIAISPEHIQGLSDLGQELTKAVAQLDHQSLLLEAILRETANVTPTKVTLEQALRERQTQAELQRAQSLDQARQAARLAAENALADRLAQLEQEVVAAEGRAMEEVLEAKEAQAVQLGRVELERVAEETRVQEAQQRAEIAGLTTEASRVDAATRAAALEREFERDLPEINSLLTAFLADGFKYRNGAGQGPASLSHIESQHGLELTGSGSFAMSFLANAGDRPAGGLKNPSSPERIRRAQELLIKYGDLMVQKQMLEP